MLNRLRSLDAIDAPFALGERILPPAPAAALAPKAVADWTRATMADLPADILSDAERGALAEAFPAKAVPAVDMHDSARVNLSSDTDPGLRAVAERMADADGWIAHDGKGMPVPGDTLIQAHCRWETSDDMHTAAPAPAKAFSASAESPSNWWAWRADSRYDMDIVAYRVVPQ